MTYTYSEGPTLSVVRVEDLAVRLDELLTAGWTESLLLHLGDGLGHLSVGHLVVPRGRFRLARVTQPLALTV